MGVVGYGSVNVVGAIEETSCEGLQDRAGGIRIRFNVRAKSHAHTPVPPNVHTLPLEKGALFHPADLPLQTLPAGLPSFCEHSRVAEPKGAVVFQAQRKYRRSGSSVG